MTCYAPTMPAGLEPYRPNSLQAKFHASPDRVRSFIADRGTGRTTALCREAILLGGRGAFVADSHWMLRDVVIPALIAADETAHASIGQGKLIRADGSMIWLLPRGLFMERMQGMSLDWIGMDCDPGPLPSAKEMAHIECALRPGGPRKIMIVASEVYN